MTRLRRPSLLGTLLVLGASLAAGGVFAACFPDYEVGGDAASDGGGGHDASTGPDGSPGSDATSGDSAADAGGMDGTLDGSGIDGSVTDAAGHDATTTDAPSDTSVDVPVIVNDAIAAYDGNPLSNMVVVDGGTFYFQVDEVSATVDASATLAYTVAIDQTEVTAGQFKQFVAAVGSGWTIAPGATLDPGGPYQNVMTWHPEQWGWTDTTTVLSDDSYTGHGCGTDVGPPLVTYGKNDAYPMTCVPWPQALAFCAWQGKRLPTETEWRFFATGQGTRLPFPWGSANVDCQHATYDDDASGCGFPATAGHALLGASRDGVYDLVGSVSEWLWDWLPVSGKYTYPANAGTNPVGPPEDVDAAGGNLSRMWINSDYTFSQSQGQSYGFTSTQGRPGSSDTSAGYDNCGFRCAKSLP
jgi:formylglycine-generating enzyme required for sulfatase activity